MFYFLKCYKLLQLTCNAFEFISLKYIFLPLSANENITVFESLIGNQMGHWRLGNKDNNIDTSGSAVWGWWHRPSRGGDMFTPAVNSRGMGQSEHQTLRSQPAGRWGVVPGRSSTLVPLPCSRGVGCTHVIVNMSHSHVRWPFLILRMWDRLPVAPLVRHQLQCSSLRSVCRVQVTLYTTFLCWTW